MIKYKKAVTFKAVDEENNKFEIIQFNGWIEVNTMDYTEEILSGNKRLETSEGYYVEFIDNENFFIPDLNKKVKKI
jgi:hypothetical protein